MMVWVAFLFLAIGSPLTDACPTETELTPPCSCSPIGFHASSVTCTKGDNEIDLQKSVQRMRSGLPIRDFYLLESSFNFLPSDLFKGLQVPTLFIGDCTLSSFSDTDTAFEGLEDSLHTLKVHETTLLDGWDWSQFRKLRSLREIHAVKSGPLSVDADIGAIAHLDLEKLQLTRSGLEHVLDGAFAPFRNLQVLSLKDNKVALLKRSMFPDPADKLAMLILSMNRIESLPDDLFSNMPALTSILLSENRITTLRQEALQPVWNNLKTLDVNGNPLRCDCRLAWFARMGKLPLNTRGTCAEPQQLKDQKINQLKAADLWC